MTEHYEPDPLDAEWDSRVHTTTEYRAEIRQLRERCWRYAKELEELRERVKCLEKAALAALDAALAEPPVIARAVEAEREAICELAANMLRYTDAVPFVDAIRARGSK
jgi:predicted  nucleic acid-binding Zn-ribbon protein